MRWEIERNKKDKFFHHEKHEEHEFWWMKHLPLRGLRELRGEDFGLRAPPAVEERSRG
jgi:hypothetical protein